MTDIQYGEFDIFVAKYDTDGNKQWVRSSGTTAYDGGFGITMNSNDNCYVTGPTGGDLDGETNAGGTYDIFISKYDTNGNKLMTKLYGTISLEQGNGIDIDSTGNIYITGRAFGDMDGNLNAGGSDILIMKVEP